MQEKRDLYNIDKKPIGKTINKGEKIPNNTYIIVVTMFIENEENKLLIQKRSREKGGKYGFLSGHPKEGESSICGIITEAYEELGLRISEEDILLIHTEKTSNKFFDFYYMKKNINLQKLKLQNEEVENVCWLSIEEIDKLINGEEFFENHIDAYEIFRSYKSQNSVNNFLD